MIGNVELNMGWKIYKKRLALHKMPGEEFDWRNLFRSSIGLL